MATLLSFVWRVNPPKEGKPPRFGFPKLSYSKPFFFLQCFCWLKAAVYSSFFLLCNHQKWEGGTEFRPERRKQMPPELSSTPVGKSRYPGTEFRPERRKQHPGTEFRPDRRVLRSSDTEKAELGSVFFVSQNRGAGTVDLWISPIISWGKH